jgi:hypothetical protein
VAVNPGRYSLVARDRIPCGRKPRKRPSIDLVAIDALFDAPFSRPLDPHLEIEDGPATPNKEKLAEILAEHMQDVPEIRRASSGMMARVLPDRKVSEESQ